MSTPSEQPLFASKPENTVAQHSTHYSHGSYLPVIIVLAVITILSIASCILGRLCLRGWNGHVSNDLEKGLDMAKADATGLKNKEDTSSKINPKVTTTLKCEVHINKNNRKKLFATRTTASVMSKKQGINRCELHGVYLSRKNNTSDLSGANEEGQP
ncbi:hypothetical protein FCM35_KLT11604 [Carex littledalei]|uniref:Uncharacterized protein n=1 Tax=Carex littledalei TaxID=544730 RepID=A0A833QRM5_9POAL|nr:hypothetical protein FCM35_KLT11604 [Carex littledalei]